MLRRELYLVTVCENVPRLNKHDDAIQSNFMTTAPSWFAPLVISLRHIGHTHSLTLSVVTNGGAEGRMAPPGKLNVKTEPPHNLYLGFSILLVVSRLFFFRFFGVFSGILGV